MKDESDKRSEVVKFEDEITAAIDGAADLTVAEIVGVMELHLHVLKCRFYPGTKKPESI